MKWDIAIDPADIKMDIKEYYEQLYTRQFDNLDKIDQSLVKYKLPQFTQYERDDLNTPITAKEIEFIILKLPHKVQMVSLENSTNV